MKNTVYQISRKDLFDLFGRLSEANRVIVPYLKGDKLSFGDFDIEREGAIELGGIRQSQPLKSFINPVRESITGGMNNLGKPLIMAGVKACDLASFKVQDFVFLEGGFKDEFYADNRANTTIIAVDCSYAKESCFCRALGGSPYPSAYFDLALSGIDTYFLVEAGSDKGRKIVDIYKTFFKAASSRALSLRDSSREKVAASIDENMVKRGVPPLNEFKGKVKENYNNTVFWKEMASTCVECGACNLVCPTCHCFLLFDAKDPASKVSQNGFKGSKRFRVHDACLYESFARVAGNHNPRKYLHERLRNRFDKKFEYFPEVLNYTACTGCGRCIDACPGNIDIREVLKGVVSGNIKRPPHD